MFLDDDDVYAAGALDYVRQVLENEPDRVHVFQMAGGGHGEPLWRIREITPGNIGTPMFVIPNRPPLPSWMEGRMGCQDHDFLANLLRLRGDTPVWHERVICQLRPG